MFIPLCVVLCFTYVSSGIQAASAIYDKVLSSLPSANDAANVRCEHLWTSYLNLLNLHAKKEHIPLKSIRVVLHRALKDYPNNPCFLDRFLQVESKSNLTGEVRRFFDHLIHDASSPVPWIYAIHYENVRSKALVSTMDCAEYITKQPSSVLVTSSTSHWYQPSSESSVGQGNIKCGWTTVCCSVENVHGI